MKHKCIISRLKEPHIARRYELDFDQNLINNLRVLCTKSPQTVRYFVPEELFLDLRNGYPIPLTAECRDKKGRRIMAIDPLKVLSEQLAKAPGAIPDPEEGLEIRILAEGYALPTPGEGMGFLKRTPRGGSASGANGNAAAQGGSASGGYGSAESQRSRSGESTTAQSGSASGGYGSAAAQRDRTRETYTAQRDRTRETYTASQDRAQETYTAGQDRTRETYKAQHDWSDDSYASAEPRKSSGVWTAIKVVAAVILLVATAGIGYMFVYPVFRFGEAMRLAKYNEAVTIYNDRILGNSYVENRADPQIESAINEIQAGFLAESRGYQDAKRELTALTKIEKSRLSQKAQSALDEIEAYESAEGVYKEGLEALSSGVYVNAIRAFAALTGDMAAKPATTGDEAAMSATADGETAKPAPKGDTAALPGAYKDSKEQLELCIDRLVKQVTGIRTEEEYPEALAKIEEAVGILPQNEELLKGREDCLARYEQIIRNTAIAAADEKMAAGDYAGALDTIAAAREKLPEDTRLEEKLADCRRSFVAHVTRATCGKVDAGDTEGAKTLLEESGKIYECEEFESLLSQVQAVEDWSAAEPREYIAGECAETRSKGSIGKPGQKDQYTVTAEASGPHRFLLSKVASGLAVRMTITASDGSVLYRSEVIGSVGAGGTDASKTSGTTGTDSSKTSGASGTGAGGSTGASGSTGGTSGTSKSSGTGASGTGASGSTGGTSGTSKSSGTGASGAGAGGAGAEGDAGGTSGTSKSSSAGVSGTGTDKSGSAGADKSGSASADAGTSAGAAATGDAVTCTLKEGETYTVDILAMEGRGSYYLTVRPQKPAADISSYEVVRDRMEFTDQQIVYSFTPEQGGAHRIDLTDAAKLSGLTVDVSDAAGARAGGAELADGEGITVRLDAGETYEIRTSQPAKTGGYVLRIGKPVPPEDLTGRNITAGAITYADQQNACKYTAAADGRFRFTIGNLPEDSRLRLDLYDSLGYKIGSGENLASGDFVTAELTEGQIIEIRLTQASGTGAYTLTVCEEEEAVEDTDADAAGSEGATAAETSAEAGTSSAAAEEEDEAAGNTGVTTADSE